MIVIIACGFYYFTFPDIPRRYNQVYNMISKPIKILTLGLIIAFNSAGLPWMNNLEDAKTRAREDNKRILLVFSGSDWCRNCILLDQEVFSSPEFQELAQQELVLLKADFPRKKKNQLSESQQSINSKLAKTFNPTGDFPKVILMDSSEQTLLISGYQQGQKAAFIEELSTKLNP
ncbi:MAG: hypothetical protein DHS20C17_07900 [Cyclobacteriaceae bacterium]|nr:MAG: hypothetical protein DHS20C17_07900 [Cyclobacteriaceae bacterium]